MAWYDTLGDILSKLPTDKVGEVISGMQNSNEMVAQINSMLMQVQRNPESAGDVSIAIIGMRGVPGLVRDLAQHLPNAAKDPNPLGLTMLVAQIQSALPRSRWF